MADQFIAFDPAANEGERLAPEVRTEIAFVAPSAVLNGSITTAKLADDSVTNSKIVAGAVTSTEIATNGVTAVNITASSVTTAKIADGAVTPAKTTTGVVTSQDSAGNSASTIIKYVTAAQYAALSVPDPNTLYFIT